MFLQLYCICVIVIVQWDTAKADCGTITRQQWGGIKPSHVVYLARPVDLVIIQHTVTGTCKTDASCADIVRSIQSFHMESLNSDDIGPSFLVGGNGKVYEGPGWLHRGAHTYGYNGRSIGVSFIGNFNNDQPTPKMLDAVKSLLTCGKENGHLTPDYRVVGHRQLIATESPGINLYNEIRGWAEWLEDIKTIKKT